MADLSADTSIYRQLQTNNPLEMAQRAIGMQNQLLEGQKLRQELQARQAYGQILQNAIDPDTGELDHKKVYTSMAQDPRVAPLANEYLKQMADLRNVDASNVILHAQGVMKNIEVLSNYAAPIAAMGPNATKKDMKDALSKAYGSGALPKDQYLSALTQINALPGQDSSPNPQIGAIAKQYVQQAQGTQQTMDQVLGSVGVINQAGQQNVVVTNPNLGTVKSLGTFAQTPTVEMANAQRDLGKTAAGAQKTAPAGSPAGLEAYPMYTGGANPALIGAGIGGTSTANPVTTPQGLSGPDVLGAPGAAAPAQTPGAGSTPLAQSPATQATAGPQPGGAFIPPNTGVYPETTRAAGAEYRKQIIGQSDQIAQSLAQTGQVLDILNKGKAQPGGLAERKGDIASVLQGLGVDQKIVNAVGNGSLSDTQVIRKYLGQGMITYLNANVARGAQSNYSLGVAQDINPNMNMTDASLRHLIGFGRKMQQVKLAEADAMDHWVNVLGRNPGEFQSAWIKTLQKRGVLGKLPGAE